MTNTVTMGGVPEGFDADIILRQMQRDERPVMHIARDDKRLAAFAEAVRFFAPDMPVIRFPAWDCLPYDRVSPNADISAQRMATLAGLVHGMPKQFILLTTLNAAMQRVPARQVLRDAAFRAEVGRPIDEEALRSFVGRMGCSKAPTVLEPGDYAIRGGIIDIYPPGDLGPIRLDLFGDILDGARRFDPVSQRTTETLSEIELSPVSEVILDEAAITRFRQNYRSEFGAARSDDPLYESISAGQKVQGFEHWLPFFHARLESLFDYLPEVCVSFDDQLEPARLARWEGIEDQYETRKLAMQAKQRMDSAASLNGHKVLKLDPLAQASGPGVIDAQGRMGRNFAPERQQETVSLFSALCHHIQKKLASGPVVLASYSDGSCERLSGLVSDEGFGDPVKINTRAQIGDAGLYVTVWGLEHGFETPDFTVISEQDILGDRLVRSAKKRRKAENFLTETQSLSAGDLVVHVDHGIGRYHGLDLV
ncbi:MAG: CarD family transcriptional regulator, partial [Alphaproteobacteria bacterium]